MNRIIIVLLLFVFAIPSCKVTDSNSCNLKEYQEVEVEFGYILNLKDRQYYKLSGNKVTNNFNNDTISLEESVACNLLEKTTQLFFKTQALNVPADSNNYFIYYNKKSNSDLRALWNPIHDNKGNAAFKALYQEYMDMIKSKDTK